MVRLFGKRGAYPSIMSSSGFQDDGCNTHVSLILPPPLSWTLIPFLMHTIQDNLTIYVIYILPIFELYLGYFKFSSIYLQKDVQMLQKNPDFIEDNISSYTTPRLKSPPNNHMLDSEDKQLSSP